MYSHKATIGGAAIVGGRRLPLSRAVRAGDFVFISGQVPLCADGALVEGSMEAQTRQVMANLEAILVEAGCTLEDVVKVNVWLADRADFAEFNRVYGEYFPDDPPARTPVVSGLLVDARLELDAIAYRPV